MRKILLIVFLACFTLSCSSDSRRTPAKGVAGTEPLPEKFAAGDLKIGDYFYTDGTWSDGGLREIAPDGTKTLISPKPLPDSGKVVAGIVFQTDQDRIGKEDKHLLRQMGLDSIHALVLAVRNVQGGTPYQWGIARDEPGLDNLRLKRDCYLDINGLTNSRYLWEGTGRSPRDYRGMAFARGFSLYDTSKVVTLNSGWFVPSVGQWWDILQNLGDVKALAETEEQYSRNAGAFFWPDQGRVADAMNRWFAGIPAGYCDVFARQDVYWTSSEYNSTFARYIGFINGYGGVYMDFGHKACRYKMRCILAF